MHSVKAANRRPFLGQHRHPPLLALGITVLLASCALLLAVFATRIGFIITATCSVALASLAVSLAAGIGDAARAMPRRINSAHLLALAAIIALFLVFSAAAIGRTELVFFDENIYQGIALNILQHGNALTCVYGSGYLRSCYYNTLSFDPSGWPFLIAVASWIFGYGAQTSHALGMLAGAASIALVFIFGSLLSGETGTGLLSAAIFALTPEALIWSNTLASPNMPFVSFALLSSVLFLLAARVPSKKLVAAFFSSMVLAIYIREEALLLIPIFAAAYLSSLWSCGSVTRALGMGAKSLGNFLSDRWNLALSVLFLVLVTPEVSVAIATAPELAMNASPFAPHIFSLVFLLPNAATNASFLLGSSAKYPAISLPFITLFALLGAAYALRSKAGHAQPLCLWLALLTFCAYFVFYSAYFSGSALLGGSSRFLLVLYPPLSVLASLGVRYASNALSSLKAGKGMPPWLHGSAASPYLAASLFAVFFAAPFLYYAPSLSHASYAYPDFPLRPNATTENGTYSMAYANRSLAFISDNYASVPENCLVFSESPYLWYSHNRSSATLDLPASYGAAMRSYSCYVLDYGYWCSYPLTAGLCSSYASRYKLQPIASESNGALPPFYLYRILNYTPN